MRRSPRPSTGRAAHPDRAVLAASYAEDVVLDLQCSEEENSASVQQLQQQGSTSSGTVMHVAASMSPKAAPRSNQNQNKPLPRPRSGTAWGVHKYSHEHMTEE